MTAKKQPASKQAVLETKTETVEEAPKAEAKVEKAVIIPGGNRKPLSPDMKDTITVGSKA